MIPDTLQATLHAVEAMDPYGKQIVTFSYVLGSTADYYSSSPIIYVISH